MAGNRLQRTGTIFERMTGLLKAGAIKKEDKPMWYDVYAAFPPKHKPTYTRQPVDKKIEPIFYPEDIIRGKFLKVYGTVSIHNLLQRTEKSIIQRFVEKYMHLEKEGNFSHEDEIFKATESVLEQEGITFIRRKGETPTDDGSQLPSA